MTLSVDGIDNERVNEDPKTSNAESNHFDVAIIGSGPAGYTASIYTSRAKLRTIVISGSLPGGQLMTTTEVENFPGFPSGINGPELMTYMQQQSERFGTTMLIDEVTKVDFRSKPFRIYTGSSNYTSDSVLIILVLPLGNWELRVNKNFLEGAYLTVQPVMALFLRIKR